MILDNREPPPSDLAGYDPNRSGGPYVYDPNAAQRAVKFFPDCLTYISGPKAGEKFSLEPWQQDIVKTLFGWKREDGTRRYRESLIMVPRKNGKTTLLAGIALYVLFCDAEAGAQCYCGASNRDQASLLFASAAEQLRQSNSGLDEVCKIRDSKKLIVYKDSFLKAIPVNEGGAHGFNAHLIIGDELHAWQKREFYHALHTSVGSRPQPMEVLISTAGWDRNSLCYEKYRYARNVRDGQIKDPKFLPVLYEAEQDDDWTDPKVWRKANPNLGVSVYPDFLETECERAKHDVSLENVFRRLYLNQWTSQESRWLNMARWRKCATTEGDIEDGSQVYGGLDLSSNVDVTAWVVAKPSENGWQIRGHYFIPEGTMRQAERRDKVPYRKWAKAGWVTPTPGDSVDYSYMHRRILKDADRYEFGAVAYDPWNAEPTRIFLEDRGLTMVKMRQGVASLGGPSKELERCVIEGTLDHGGDPVLEWMAENVQVKTDDNGNIRPIKPEHGGYAKRIDGIVAAIMAIGVGQNSEPAKVSVFDTEWNF